MRYAEFYSRYRKYIVFSLQDIEKVYPTFYRARLNEWQHKGYIQKIINKYYIFSDVKVDENVLYVVSNKIYSPSYISLEMALSYYNFTPEAVYKITSVSSSKTSFFETALVSFNYCKIRSDLFFGYSLVQVGDNIFFKIAEPEKVILDYLYLNPKIKKQEDFEGLRFNREEILARIDLKKLERYLLLYNNQQLETRIKRLREFLQNA